MVRPLISGLTIHPAAGAGAIGRPPAGYAGGAPLPLLPEYRPPPRRAAALHRHIFPPPWEQDGLQPWPLTAQVPTIAWGLRRVYLLVRLTTPTACRAVCRGRCHPRPLCTPQQGAAVPAGGRIQRQNPQPMRAAGGLGWCPISINSVIG